MTRADAQGNSRLFCKCRNFLLRKNMKYDIRFKCTKNIFLLLLSFRSYFIPIRKFIHMLAAGQHRARISSANKNDPASRKFLFQDPRERQGEHHVPNAVGAADDEGFTLHRAVPSAFYT